MRWLGGAALLLCTMTIEGSHSAYAQSSEDLSAEEIVRAIEEIQLLAHLRLDPYQPSEHVDRLTRHLNRVAKALRERPDAIELLIARIPPNPTGTFGVLIRLCAHSRSERARSFLSDLCRIEQDGVWSAIPALVSWYARDETVYLSPTEGPLNPGLPVRSRECLEFLSELLWDQGKMSRTADYVLSTLRQSFGSFPDELRTLSLRVLRESAPTQISEREAAIVLLHSVAPTPKLLPELRTLLDAERTPVVRFRLRIVLLQHGLIESNEVLAELHDPRNRPSLPHLVYSIPMSLPERGLWLIDLLKRHSEDDVRIAVTKTLSNDRSPAVVAALLDMSASPCSPALRTAIVRWCGVYCVQDGIPEILANIMAQEEDPRARALCVSFLHPAAPGGLVLLEKIANDDPSDLVRKAAVERLRYK